MNRIAADFRVPRRHARFFRHANAEHAPEDLEHSRYHAFQREIRPQLFFIEIVQGGALLLGPITDVPGIESRVPRTPPVPDSLHETACRSSCVALR